MVIVIDDELHCEFQGKFKTFEDAFAELKRRAIIPWDEAPNVAQCTSWRTCGREYHIAEYDDSQKPWKLLREVKVLDVSAKGVDWASDFGQTWHGGYPLPKQSS
jgi:hypothetical protein